jgi:hypothetical protein
MRCLLRFAVAAGLVCGAAVANAQVRIQPLPAPAQPGAPGARPVRPQDHAGPAATQKVVQSQLVVSGTVSVGKETESAVAYTGAPVKTTYRVATVKVTDTLVGAKAEAVKVLLPPADPTYANDPFPGQPPQPYTPQFPQQIQLIDGQEGTFFLVRHPTVADAYLHAGGSPPLNPLDTKYKAELAEVKAVAAVYADPLKALKAEKAEDKMRAAYVLVNKYRRPPVYDGKQHEQKAIPAEEAKLIFQALADADWEVWDKPQQPNEVRDWAMNPTGLLNLLQIYAGAKGAANFPQVRQQPGQGYHAAYKAAFDAWREGAGKDFEIKRFVQPGEKGDEPKK